LGFILSKGIVARESNVHGTEFEEPKKYSNAIDIGDSYHQKDCHLRIKCQWYSKAPVLVVI
jgi:hypothetical protein